MEEFLITRVKVANIGAIPLQRRQIQDKIQQKYPEAKKINAVYEFLVLLAVDDTKAFGEFVDGWRL